ncbi:hypothetical protein Syun_012130 [Stephania yunnanensis]|uniref:Uncharacterized protein n=1 Tax=Stephania yunnanensis TaxID=152371 RepID=A0AAP0JZX3_9MAGN
MGMENLNEDGGRDGKKYHTHADIKSILTILFFNRIAMLEESSTRRKVDDEVHEEVVPAYLLDRESTTRAKVLSKTIKQKRKEKAGKWEVPLPKVRPVAEDEMFRVTRTRKRKSVLYEWAGMGMKVHPRAGRGVGMGMNS